MIEAELLQVPGETYRHVRHHVGTIEYRPRLLKPWWIAVIVSTSYRRLHCDFAALALLAHYSKRIHDLLPVGSGDRL